MGLIGSGINEVVAHLLSRRLSSEESWVWLRSSRHGGPWAVSASAWNSDTVSVLQCRERPSL